MLNSSRTVMAAGVAIGSALAYGIFRRYRATLSSGEAEPVDRFFSLNGVRVTVGAEKPLDYTEVDGIKLTRIGPDRL